jgi:hypothetical protein
MRLPGLFNYTVTKVEKGKLTLFKIYELAVENGSVVFDIPYNKGLTLELRKEYSYYGESIDDWLDDPYKVFLRTDYITENNVYSPALVVRGGGVFLAMPVDFEYFKKAIVKLFEIGEGKCKSKMNEELE